MQKSEQLPIVCITSTSWETDFLQSTIELVSLLALDTPVLYVDYAYTWKDVVLSLLGRKKIHLARILGFKNRVRVEQTRYQSSVNVLSPPPCFPTNWINNTSLHDLINEYNARYVKKCIIKYLKINKLHQYDVINAWNPILGVHLLGLPGSRQVVYYCYDNIASAKWVGKHGARFEKQYLSMVDKVIVTSAQLVKDKMPFVKKCFLVQNGVDFSLFNKQFFPFKKIANRIGYVGTIDNRLDIALMAYLASQLPDYEFLYIGRVVDASVVEKMQYPNVQFIGSIPYESLPVQVNLFSACIIPFVKNSFTAAIYPMKINEYLALGKPVISTNFSDLSDFDSVCSITDTADNFLTSLKDALQNDSEYLQKQRINIAAQNSWQKRAQLFRKYLLEN